MDDRLWIVTVFDEGNTQYMAFPIEWKAKECCSHWQNEGYEAEVEQFRPVNNIDKDWRAEAESTLKDFIDISAKHNELKKQFDEVTEKLHNEIHQQREDINVLKEAIVRQMLKEVKLWS